MVKKKVEMEVEYPDCIVCGEGIFDGEEYNDLSVSIARYTCHRGDGYVTSGIGTGRNQITYHEKCAGKVGEHILRRIREMTKENLSK